MAQQLDLLSDLPVSERKGPIDALLTPDQIYESDDADLFVRLTEDGRIERKGARTQPAGLGPVFSAFSNGPSTRGGVIVFGIADKTRQIEGCQSLSEDRLQGIESAAMVFCPSARVVSRRASVVRPDGQPDFIILFRVFYVTDRLITVTDGKAYERLADKTKEMDDARKQQVRVDKGERPFEVEACSISYPEGFDLSAIQAFCNRVRSSRGASDQHKDEHVLVSVRLGSHLDDRFVPNNACALLFAKDPRWAFPGAIIHFLKYRGTMEGSGNNFNVEKDRQIEGGIATLIRDASAVIDANLQEFTEWRNGRFETTVEYPRDAWYELLVNACAHRSYIFRNVPIFVKMFDDRLVFQSPGGLMPGVTPENIFDRHHPRNRIIMDALRETGEVRCINEGTKRVRGEMARASLPAPRFQDQPGEAANVLVTLFNNAAARANVLSPKARLLLGSAAAQELSEEEKRILNYVASVGRVTVSAVMGVLGDTRWHTTNLKLTRLMRRGLLFYSSTKLRDPNAHFAIATEGQNEQREP